MALENRDGFGNSCSFPPPHTLNASCDDDLNLVEDLVSYDSTVKMHGGSRERDEMVEAVSFFFFFFFRLL